ncbi:MAG: restriction endonuclease subunit S [Dolichospermum sp. WA123]|nr:restriction endonuclease subunit S [Dolichospermum sp. WA123]
MSEQPPRWVTATLADVTEYISRGKSPKYTNYSSLPVINQKAIRWFGIQQEYLKYVDPAQFDFWTPERFIRIGDVLWNSTGTGTMGRACLVTERDVEIPKVVDSHVTIVRANQAVIEPRFLFAWIQSPEIQADIASLATGTTNQIELSQAVIASIRIPIPHLNEQKRIADKLDILLAKATRCCDRLNYVSSILKRFRQGVVNAATSGQLIEDGQNFRNHQTSFIHPEFDTADKPIEQHPYTRWQKALIGDLLDEKPRNGYSPRPVEFETQTRSLSLSATTSGRFNSEFFKYINETIPKDSHLWLKPGDILIQRANTLEYVGVSAIYHGPSSSYIYPDLMMKCRANNKILTEFLYYLLSSSAVRAYFRANATGTSGNMPKINQQTVISAPVRIPCIDEQQEIVRCVETLFTFADRLEARYQAARTQVERLTPTLLDKAFRGELVPQDPNDESVSVLIERIQTEKARIETERKTTHIVRRSTKESRKNIMKKPSDYSEALSSAFAEIGRKPDARQLFDQAGFKAEEVVQFYETLRATPEVRAAFKERVGESPQQQNSLVDSTTEKNGLTNGRFRLVELWLEDFKNLTDYTIRFDPSHSIDIVLGWNGTGKSNLFEALVIIFRDLHEWKERNRWTEKPMKGYRLCYQIDEHTVEVSWHQGEMKRPNLKMGILQEATKESDNLKSINRGKLPLPRFVFGYYSGPTNRLAEHFLPMKQAHYARLRDAISDDPATLTNLLEQRRFFCAENHHAKYVLLAFFHKEDADISRFLEDRLRIVGFESALFIIRQPIWARKGQTADDFWGATGIMRRVMERLRRFAIAPMIVEQKVSDGYRSGRENHYYFFLPDLQSLHAFAAEYQNARTFFLALESTDFSELIYDLKIQVRVKVTHTEQVAITFHELSEGEQQLLMVLGLMRFTKSHQSLVLLDEPDTHLNPHWNVDYLKLLTHVMSESSSKSEEQQTSQILMSTHDPLVIASLVKEQIHLLKRDWQTGVCKWEQPTVNPRGLGFTGILTSEMFGMRSDLDEETLADLDTKVRLIAKEDSLTPEEFAELEEINKRLEDAGFQKAFSDPYYAAFIRAWSRRHSELMAGVRFLNPAQQEEIDRIARELLEETIAELQKEEMD